MSKTQQENQVLSEPTMCLKCHIVVVMRHDADADLKTGAWECPTRGCGHKYPFAHWKIKKAKKKRKASS